MKSTASHCVETTWNKALTLQQEIESWYNKKAINFNDFLRQHRQKTLLHKKYSREELVSLLQSSSKSEQKQIQQRISASEHIVAMLQGEAKQINKQSDLVKVAYANWSSIYDHCNQAGLAINSSSSQRYMQLNQNILTDIKNLLNKYKLLIELYETEVKTLKAIKY
ncbi:hypothetical protein [Vibrio sp.]|uniref:hypothetical protein n=1 Tax=Vibrio sp. TaxID=678 RepID=UPI00311FC12B